MDALIKQISYSTQCNVCCTFYELPGQSLLVSFQFLFNFFGAILENNLDPHHLHTPDKVLTPLMRHICMKNSNILVPEHLHSF